MPKDDVSPLKEVIALWDAASRVDLRPPAQDPDREAMAARDVARVLGAEAADLVALWTDPRPMVAAHALLASYFGGHAFDHLPRELQDRREAVVVETRGYTLHTNLGGFARFLRQRAGH